MGQVDGGGTTSEGVTRVFITVKVKSSFVMSLRSLRTLPLLLPPLSPYTTIL